MAVDITSERLKVLLIEHDPAFANRMSEMLGEARELSAEMSSAASLDDGLHRIAEDSYDVVVLDVSLPDGAGLANVSLVHAEAPDVPVIVAGDVEHETMGVEAVQSGAQDYLVKGQLTAGWLERSIRNAIERHRIDLALSSAEAQYHSVFDHLVEGIFRTTPEGKYLLANPALARIYGYACPEELMMGITDIGRRLYVQLDRRAEFVRLMEANDVITGFESQIFRKDGTPIWISENCRAVRDNAGTLLYFEGTVEDITKRVEHTHQRQEAERKLEQSEALYHSLVENLPQNIFRKDLEGRFTFGNQQFCKAMGRTLDELLGKTDADFFPAGLAKKYQNDDRKVIETGKAYQTVEEYQPPGQRKMYVQVVKTPLRGADGQIIGLQGIFWDITEQRMTEEKNRRVTQLLAENRRVLRSRHQEMTEDLKMAREIQLSMLPQQYPSFPLPTDPSKSAFVFTHRYIPAGTVGGDFFTVSALSESEAGVFICDVAGHGVRAALVTAMIRAIVEELKTLAANPGEFLTRLNRDMHTMLRPSGSPLLTTAFYMVADSRDRKICYANAGHPKPLHVRKRPAEVKALANLNSNGRTQPALGLFPNAKYETSTVSLSPGDIVMLFTDGLYEVINSQDEIYTQASLVREVEQLGSLPEGQMLDELLVRIRQFAGANGFTDDVCVVGMEVAE